MNANLSRWVLAFLEDSRGWSRAILLVLRLYGVAALVFIWLVIHYGTPGRLRRLGAPILDPALLLGYVLCLSALSVVGFKQLRSGVRQKGLLNVGLAALTGLLGCCAWYLLCRETGRWH
jgi:hypothetical protein